MKSSIKKQICYRDCLDGFAAYVSRYTSKYIHTQSNIQHQAPDFETNRKHKFAILSFICYNLRKMTEIIL